MSNKKSSLAFSIALLIPLSVGLLGSGLSENAPAIYESLPRPDFSPPAYIFPIVWTILYLLMGISSYIIYVSPYSKERTLGLAYYIASLVFNGLWSYLFFGLNQQLLAFFCLVVLFVLVLLTVYYYQKVNKVAAYLQIPYLLWLIFAGILNLTLVS